MLSIVTVLAVGFGAYPVWLQVVTIQKQWEEFAWIAEQQDENFSIKYTVENNELPQILAPLVTNGELGYVTSLELNNSNMSLDGKLLDRLARLPKLEKLTIEGGMLTSLDTIKLAQLEHLKSLTVRGGYYSIFVYTLHRFEESKNLERIEIVGGRLKWQERVAFKEKCPNVQLIVQSTSVINNLSLEEMEQYATLGEPITKINRGYIGTDDNEYIQRAIELFPDLAELELSGKAPLNRKTLQCIADQPQLTRFQYNGVTQPTASMQHSFELAWEVLLPGFQCETLSASCSSKSKTFSATSVKDSNRNLVRKLTIRYSNFRSSRTASDSSTPDIIAQAIEPSDIPLEHIKSFLTRDEFFKSDFGLKQLQRMPNLKSAQVSAYANADFEFLNHLGKLKRLEELSLTMHTRKAVALPEFAFKNWESSQSLRTISLNNFSFEPANFLHLASFPKLESVLRRDKTMSRGDPAEDHLPAIKKLHQASEEAITE